MLINADQLNINVDFVPISLNQHADQQFNMEEKEIRKVICLNCGHVWETKAKRPQCSVCKSTKTEDLGDEEEIRKENEEFENADPVESVDQQVENQHDELEDVDVEKLIEEEAEGFKKLKHSAKKFGVKLGSKALLIFFAFGLLGFFLMFYFPKTQKRETKETREAEEGGYNPFSALGGW